MGAGSELLQLTRPRSFLDLTSLRPPPARTTDAPLNTRKVPFPYQTLCIECHDTEHDAPPPRRHPATRFGRSSLAALVWGTNFGPGQSCRARAGPQGGPQRSENSRSKRHPKSSKIRSSDRPRDAHFRHSSGCGLPQVGLRSLGFPCKAKHPNSPQSENRTAHETLSPPAAKHKIKIQNHMYQKNVCSPDSCQH